MSTDLATCSSLPSTPNPLDQAPEKNSLKTGQNRAFSDIDPNFRLSNIQCRAIDLALDGLRWSQIASILNLDCKTLWRWKTQNPEFQQALADARADRHQFTAERCESFANRAMSVLAKFLEDPADKNRMRAAQLFLQAAARFQPPRTRPVQTRQVQPDYPPEYPKAPLITPPPTPSWIEPDLEPKVG